MTPFIRRHPNDDVLIAHAQRACGAQSKSEKHGDGQNKFAPWQVGAVM